MKTLVGIYLALLLLLILTLLGHRLQLGLWGTVLSLTIASAKTGLIAWFFMELKTSSPLARLAAGTGLLWIFFFYFLGALDIFFRPSGMSAW